MLKLVRPKRSNFRPSSIALWAGIVLGSIVSVWLLVMLIKAGERLQHDARNLHKYPTDENKREHDASLERVRGLVTGIGTLATIVGGAFVFWNIRLTQTRLVTERFSKAVEQLGSDKIEVRLGGIYALERIAQDSERDHWVIMEVLTSFIREKSPNKKLSVEQINVKAYELWKASGETTSSDENWNEAIAELSKISEDVQAALTVIGRRNIQNDPLNKSLNLSNANLNKASLSSAGLQGVSLIKANLQGASLWKANLQGANFWKANLQGASFLEANLQGANFLEVNLQGIDFFEANLQETDLVGVNLQEANLTKANLYRADLTKASLQEAKLSRANLQGANFLEANLQGANFLEANLQGADLTKANLQGAKLIKANLKGALLKNADLRRADLVNANLYRADLQKDQLDQALLCRTILMDGTVTDRDCDQLRAQTLLSVDLQDD